MTTVNTILVTWLLTAALPELAAGTPAGVHCSSVTRYLALHRLAAEPGATWVNPSLSKRGSKYWQRILPDPSAQTAWTRQAPFRAALSPTVTTTLAGQGVTVTADTYLHPSGVSVLLNAKFVGDLPYTDLLGFHQRLALDEVFAGADGLPRTAGSLVHRLLDEATATVLGGPSVGARIDDEPLRVTTIARVTGATARSAATAKMVRLSYPGQPAGEATPLEPKSGKGADTIRVPGDGSVVIWSPQRSRSNRGEKSVSCYHVNQTLALAEVRQLLQTARLAGTLTTSTPHGQTLFRAAVENLANFDGTTGDGYHSETLSDSITRSGLVPQIDRVRAYFSLGPIRTT